MKYKIIGDLFAWIFPTKNDRAKFKTWCKLMDIKKNVPLIKNNYKKTLKSIQNKTDKKVVLFLVNEVAKWKGQSLYDLFAQSDNYDPYIALTIGDFQWNIDKEKRKEVLLNNFAYFKSKNMDCVYAYDLNADSALDLSIFNPDIVFYQQPWKIPPIQMPSHVSNFAITFYFPYYVQNYGNFIAECSQELHQTVFRYYIINEEWEKLYKICFKYAAGEIKGIGHPALDLLQQNKDKKCNKNYVIYAPHHSINNCENFSTFMKNGKYILDFAKKHTEINWVFKPHPTLKYRLINDGILSETEINSYFEEWEKFATCCYDSNYYELFLDSKALITDSASFLTEYFCTEKPIIHLISSKSKVIPLPPFEKILNTFYKVKNINDLNKAFDEILIKNQDSKKEERISLLKECNLHQKNASLNIMQDINNLLGVTDERH